MCSVALVLAFLSAENENRQLEDLPPGQSQLNEDFENWKLRPLLFFNHDSTHFSSLGVSANAL